MSVAYPFAQQHSVVPERLRHHTHALQMQALGYIDDAGNVDLTSCASLLVQPGYFSAEQCTAILCAIPTVAEETARDAVLQVWSNFHQWQQSIAAQGDWGRFEAALADLDQQGILVRQMFTCCRSCGDDEIGSERGQVEGRSPEWAYVFFTQKDSYALAAEYASLWLSYELFDFAPSIPQPQRDAAETDQATRDDVVARSYTELTSTIIAALHRQNLTVEWDGDPRTRIRVVDMDWRRPIGPPTPVRRPRASARPRRHVGNESAG